MAASCVFPSFSFNKNGNLFSFYGDDGKLKIWDTSTGVLKQDYTKNLHLSAPCTTLLWLEITKQHGPKRKSSLLAPSYNDHLDVIALGTTTGKILLYNVALNNVLAELEGHTSKVNRMCISKSNSLYSCSNDRRIIEWDLSKYKIKSKWKTPREKVNCLLALSNGNLVSGSTNIKLWDVETHQVLKTFTGHATEVMSLLGVPGQEMYFISAARGDRILSAWSLKSTQDGTSALASFVMQDGPSSVYLQTNDDVTSIFAVTEGGSLHVFKRKLNGTVKKPVKPSHTFSIAVENTQGKEVSRPLPIFSVLSTTPDSLHIAYGAPGLMNFELLAIDNYKEENVLLLRQDKRRLNGDEFNSRAKVPIISDDVEYQGPGKAAVKRSGGKQMDLPLEERLENLALAKTPGTAPKKDNMAQLLCQGLQSKDRTILHNILHTTEESVVHSTVRHLPAQALPSLLRVLVHQVQGKTVVTRAAVQWLVAVLRVHSAVLLANPDACSLFEPLLQSVETRASLLAPLLRLRGRLGLVTEQLGRNSGREEDEVAEPLVTYVEEESSEDSSEEEQTDHSRENSNGNWSEFSDMEEDDNEEEKQ